MPRVVFQPGSRRAVGIVGDGLAVLLADVVRAKHPAALAEARFPLPIATGCEDGIRLVRNELAQWGRKLAWGGTGAPPILQNYDRAGACPTHAAGRNDLKARE